ncbi:MAG: hypothetical protein HYX59_01230 [Elusimicrobia bacterium]|nr:hypothetical protein [Elusimicrobiota bacterium]
MLIIVEFDAGGFPAPSTTFIVKSCELPAPDSEKVGLILAVAPGTSRLTDKATGTSDPPTVIAAELIPEGSNRSIARVALADPSALMVTTDASTFNSPFGSARLMTNRTVLVYAERSTSWAARASATSKAPSGASAAISYAAEKLSVVFAGTSAGPRIDPPAIAKWAGAPETTRRVLVMALVSDRFCNGKVMFPLSPGLTKTVAALPDATAARHATTVRQITLIARRFTACLPEYHT